MVVLHQPKCFIVLHRAEKPSAEAARSVKLTGPISASSVKTICWVASVQIENNTGLTAQKEIHSDEKWAICKFSEVRVEASSIWVK